MQTWRNTNVDLRLTRQNPKFDILHSFSSIPNLAKMYTRPNQFLPDMSRVLKFTSLTPRATRFCDRASRKSHYLCTIAQDQYYLVCKSGLHLCIRPCISVGLTIFCVVCQCKLPIVLSQLCNCLVNSIIYYLLLCWLDAEQN